MSRPPVAAVAAVTATVTSAAAVGLPAAQAVSASPATLYVSPTGSVSNDGSSCDKATYTSIETAVTAATAGSTVVACAGTYQEFVTVNTPITLTGRGAVIDAT